MTVDASFVFVIAILSAENSGTDGAGEVFNVVFSIEGSNVRATKCSATVVAQEIQSSKIIGLT